MSVRAYIYSLITTDPAMVALGITPDSTFTQHTIDTPQVRPMCILRWQGTTPGIVTTAEGNGLSDFPVNQRILTVWVHDDKHVGDYTNIDRSLNRLRALLTSVEGIDVGVTGSRLTAINWEGDSQDLSDDDAGTITRNAQFRLTGSAI